MSNLQAPKTQHELVLRLIQGEVFQKPDTKSFVFYHPDNFYTSPFRVGKDCTLNNSSEMYHSWCIEEIIKLIPVGQLLPNGLNSKIATTPDNHISKIGIIYESDEGDRILQTYKGDLLVLKQKDDL